MVYVPLTLAKGSSHWHLPQGIYQRDEHRNRETFTCDAHVVLGKSDWRLEAFGYGDSDPVAPDAADGQPLNRRVVVVIDPATAAGAG